MAGEQQQDSCIDAHMRMSCICICTYVYVAPRMCSNVDPATLDSCACSDSNVRSSPSTPTPPSHPVLRPPMALEPQMAQLDNDIRDAQNAVVAGSGDAMTGWHTNPRAASSLYCISTCCACGCAVCSAGRAAPSGAPMSTAGPASRRDPSPPSPPPLIPQCILPPTHPCLRFANLQRPDETHARWETGQSGASPEGGAW